MPAPRYRRPLLAAALGLGFAFTLYWSGLLSPRPAPRYANGKMQDLNELIPRDADWTLENARGINDRGQIVGQGLQGGRERAFLLTPR